MSRDSNTSGTSQCIVAMLLFVAVGILYAILLLLLKDMATRGGARSWGPSSRGGGNPPIRRARHPAAAPDPPAGNQAPALPWHGDGGSESGAGGGENDGPEGGFEDDGLDALVAALDDEE